jgi:hypothetical protein
MHGTDAHRGQATGESGVQEPDMIHEFIKEAVKCIFTLTI